MPLRRPTSSIRRILHNAHFYIWSCIALVAFWFSCFGTTYFTIGDHPKEMRQVFSLVIMAEIVLWCIAATAASFAASGPVRTRIIYGHQPALAHKALVEGNFFTRFLFFSVRFEKGWQRLIVAMLNSIMVCGSVVIVLLLVACEASRPDDPFSFSYSGGSGLGCYIPNPFGYSAVAATWRSFIVMTVHTINYIAAHNSRHAAFAKVPNLQGGYGVPGEAYGEGDGEEGQQPSEPQSPAPINGSAINTHGSSQSNSHWGNHEDGPYMYSPREFDAIVIREAGAPLDGRRPRRYTYCREELGGDDGDDCTAAAHHQHYQLGRYAVEDDGGGLALQGSLTTDAHHGDDEADGDSHGASTRIDFSSHDDGEGAQPLTNHSKGDDGHHQHQCGHGHPRHSDMVPRPQEACVSAAEDVAAWTSGFTSRRSSFVGAHPSAGESHMSRDSRRSTAVEMRPIEAPISMAPHTRGPRYDEKEAGPAPAASRLDDID